MNEEYDEGYQARRGAENPYERGSPEHHDWERGYDTARWDDDDNDDDGPDDYPDYPEPDPLVVLVEEAVAQGGDDAEAL